MPRPRPTRAVAAALLAAVSLGACAGGGDATQGGVRDDVLSAMVDSGEGQAVAGAVADCVSRGLFEGDFTKEERNAAARASDGDAPDADLVERVEALFADCEADAERGAAEDADADTDTEG